MKADDAYLRIERAILCTSQRAVGAIFAPSFELLN